MRAVLLVIFPVLPPRTVTDNLRAPTGRGRHTENMWNPRGAACRGPNVLIRYLLFDQLSAHPLRDVDPVPLLGRHRLQRSLNLASTVPYLIALPSSSFELKCPLRRGLWTGLRSGLPGDRNGPQRYPRVVEPITHTSARRHTALLHADILV